MESPCVYAGEDVNQSLISQETMVVTVADREADIYDLLVLPRRPNSELLIRATHNRSVKRNAEAQQVERLDQVMQQIPACGQLTLELRRHPEREARTATLTQANNHLGIATTTKSSSG